ncbi:M16 family metallopeptidase [Primorskyibacter sp. 2E107]|uniref:M16 family metallopeptidase n=1 Tax=Primorskyibacter sp. 2E107 TaxID=3403458 RepID=UPI003AF55AA4
MIPRVLEYGLLRLGLMAIALVLGVASNARAEMTVQGVETDSGLSAWLIEDYSRPIVTLRFAFDGGSRADPVGQSGIAYLMSGLMDEGAGEMESAAFLSAVDAAGAEMSFFVREDHFGGSLRVLRDDAEPALALLRLAINEPRFDASAVERIRGQILNSLAAQSRNPEARASRAQNRAIYGDHLFARNRKGDPAEVAGVTAEDLRRWHQTQFVRDGLHVAVMGAVSQKELAAWLDLLFGALPERAARSPVAAPVPEFGDTVQIPSARPSTLIQMTYPAPGLAEEGYPEAAVLNHILGGAPLSSRLFDALRTARGLVYGVNSGLDPDTITPQLVISTQTRADQVSQVLGVIQGTVQRLADEGPTPDELSGAISYLRGAYFVRNFSGSQAATATMLSLQLDGLSPEYLKTRGARFDAVRAPDVQAGAARLAAMTPTVLLVGPGEVSN